MKNLSILNCTLLLFCASLFFNALQAQVAPGDLVITEIMNNPAAVDDADGEWFEVYNATAFPINMMGMTIKDLDIDEHVIASSLLVPAGDYVVLGNNADMATNGGVNVDYEYGSGWSIANGADEVIITHDGIVIDQVAYDGGPVFPNPNGASMSLDPAMIDAIAHDDGSNWCESTYVFGAGDKGTPGVENLPCVFNDPPVAICKDVTAAANEDCVAFVSAEQIDNGSYDPTGDPDLIEVSPEGPYDLGETTVTLTITDDKGEADQCTATITVIDESEPVLDVIDDPITLWPPNHKYQTVSLDQLFVDFTDNCTALTMDNVNISSVSSDEEENSIGSGDGNTLNDILIGNDCKSVQLRSERNGNGNGRVYTIYLAVEDGNGNTATASCLVYVPVSNNQIVLDDGPVYGQNCAKSALAVKPIATSVTRLENFPNPFSTVTTITFSVSVTGYSSIKVFNLAGMEVASLYASLAEQGKSYSVEFESSGLPGGIYFCQMQTAGGESITTKMVLSR